jgi:hypothetical protein
MRERFSGGILYGNPSAGFTNGGSKTLSSEGTVHCGYETEHMGFPNLSEHLARLLISDNSLTRKSTGW